MMITLAAFEWSQFLRPDIIWVVIPVVAMVMGGIVGILKQMNKHEQRMEMIRSPEIYQQFFARLSKAVFLEAHRI